MSAQPHPEAAEPGATTKPGAMLARAGDRSGARISSSPASVAATANGAPSPGGPDAAAGSHGQGMHAGAHEASVLDAKVETSTGQGPGSSAPQVSIGPLMIFRCSIIQGRIDLRALLSSCSAPWCAELLQMQQPTCGICYTFLWNLVMLDTVTGFIKATSAVVSPP